MVVLDVNRLRVFRAVVASGSIQAAATNLGFTPSAVSQQVAQLARETGLVLLERVGRGVAPTGAGLELAAIADGVLEAVGQAEARVEDLRSGRGMALTVAYFDSAGIAWMPDVLRSLLADFPDLRLDLALRENAPHEVDRVDVQVVVAPADYVPPTGLRAHRLLAEPYLVAVPAGHRLAARRAVDLADLAGDTWVDNDTPEGWCRRIIDTSCAAAGFVPARRVEALDHFTALAFVSAGVGISVVPRLCTVGMPEGVVALNLANPTPTRTIFVVVRDAVADTPAVCRLVHLLHDRAARTQAAPTEPDGLARAAVVARTSDMEASGQR